MQILSVAYPLFPVSPDSTGGAEQILSVLERGIVQAGHQSLVIAAEGSRVSGKLLATQAAGATISEEDRARAQLAHRERIEQTLQNEAVDLIHFHGLDFNTYLPSPTIPAVVTLHLPVSWYAQEIFGLSGFRFVCVSHQQASTLPADLPFTVIPNGVDPVGEDPDEPRRDFLLWLGRICPEKGTHIALRIAHRLDLPMVVAGPVYGFASHAEYFRAEVEPLLDEKRRYIGPVRRPEKKRLLRQARALLHPSLAPETSSLVAMESMSAGTPVIAFASGALPEVIDHGVTGYIVHSEDEMAETVSKLNTLARIAAIGGADRMIAGYLAFYERVISNRHFSLETAPQEVL